MKRVFTISVLMLALLVATSAMAADDARRHLNLGGYGVITGGSSEFSKQAPDTVYMMGPGSQLGRFETGWNGWTSRDITQITESHWHVSDYKGDVTGANPSATNLVAYVGDETLPPCGAGEPEGGYGNSWLDWMDWYGTAPTAGASTTVGVEFYINYNTEAGYDFLEFQVERSTGMDAVMIYDGNNIATPNLFESFTFSVSPSDYVGPTNNQIHLRWAFSSDGAWSDEDCLNPTDGAAQIDDLRITFDGVQVAFDDFQSSKATLGNWTTVLPPGVGNFAQLFVDLEDNDPCNFNYSQQVAFIDDGIVVPGTGGTPCISWCYGPDGYIVNNTGGLAGPDYHLHNWIYSPILTWPTGTYDGGLIRYLVYRHEELGAGSVWPGIFYIWGVRSVATGNPADIEAAAFQDRNFVYYGGPDYAFFEDVVTDLLEPGRTHVQMMLGVYELGYAWGWYGNDGTPAPYFDNAVFAAFQFPGPGISAREIDLFQDTFPERGSIDYGNLGVNHARMDMARDISGDSLTWDYGDSIVMTIAPVRTGSQLTGNPRLYYALKTNSLYNGVRGTDMGTPDVNGVISGYVLADTIRSSLGFPVQDRWFFDLPDTGHFFPGDVLHYYIWSEDVVGGSDFGLSTLPADIDGFGDFSHPLAYNSSFVVRILPTVTENPSVPGTYVQPKILFWNDFANRGGEQEWHNALLNNGYVEGVHYDTYYTNGPSSGVGNGLGGTATPSLLSGYTTLLYTSGNLSSYTITPHYHNPNGDKPDDAALLTAWFETGNKNAFYTGDDLAYDLDYRVPSFLANFVGVDFQVKSVQSAIGNQITPLVLPVAGSPFSTDLAGGWIADGGCPGINSFDGVVPIGATQTGAVFANASGTPGGYAYSAATYRADATYNNKYVYLPYDLRYVMTPDGTHPYSPRAARTKLLGDVLVYFGELGGPAVGVPSAQVLTTRNYPNPFNPNTTIEFTLPRAGAVSMKIYNVKGELVRTLLNDVQMAADAHKIVWEGDNDQGGKVASGVYFYEVRSNGQTRINKMALVK
ncbi:MAG: T9SS type A sorting domain-containing protein [Candidatus Krumholzibacteriia bacterium]